MQKVSKKIILVGNFGVGKTSLTKRFVHQKFSDEYLTTLGVKIDKKAILIREIELTMLVWDIAGEVMQSKVPPSYFLGAQGIIYVLDLSRPSTYVNIKEDFAYLHKLLPNMPYIVAGNKKDLVPQDELPIIINQLEIPCDFLTSAKTGEGVEEMFHRLGEKMLGFE